MPLLEPADSQECADMMRVGLEISEQFDTPVLLRTTTAWRMRSHWWKWMLSRFSDQTHGRRSLSTETPAST